MHNTECNCLNCPAAEFYGRDAQIPARFVMKQIEVSAGDEDNGVKASCRRRPELGRYNPVSVTFKDCPEWVESEYGYILKDMRVMILGIDGYLGWALALWLGSLGCQVSGVDNFSRRDWLKERGSHTVVPIARMTERLHTARDVLGIDINFREIDILNGRKLLEGFIDEVKPEAIVHYGECPSAPYSMIDAEHAINVQTNNVMGTLGLLFMMRDIVPQSSLVKLGTMGEYGTPLSGRPLFEGIFPNDAVLRWNNQEWSLGGEMTPRDPGSFYHISKVQDTSNIFGACKYWGLRSYDIMQGVIYGVHTPQVSADPKLRTRLDIDEWFGTIVNRFVAQAVIGIPLTLFGTGNQIRGFIALEDAMQCMTRIIAKPPEPGRYNVVNQLSGYYSMREMAETVAGIGKRDFGLDVKIQRIENPRVETMEHPYKPIYDRLKEEFGFKQKDSLDEEIHRMFELLTQREIKMRIEEKRHNIIPHTWWSGLKKKAEQIELIRGDR